MSEWILNWLLEGKMQTFVVLLLRYLKLFAPLQLAVYFKLPCNSIQKSLQASNTSSDGMLNKPATLPSFQSFRTEGRSTRTFAGETFLKNLSVSSIPVKKSSGSFEKVKRCSQFRFSVTKQQWLCNLLVSRDYPFI